MSLCTDCAPTNPVTEEPDVERCFKCEEPITRVYPVTCPGGCCEWGLCLDCALDAGETTPYDLLGDDEL